MSGCCDPSKTWDLEVLGRMDPEGRFKSLSMRVCYLWQLLVGSTSGSICKLDPGIPIVTRSLTQQPVLGHLTYCCTVYAPEPPPKAPRFTLHQTLLQSLRLQELPWKLCTEPRTKPGSCQRHSCSSMSVSPETQWSS